MFVVTAWKSGRHGPDTMYGLSVDPDDRDRYFRRAWRQVQLRLPGQYGIAMVRLTPSFWRDCPELRSNQIRAWLRGTRLAPWPYGRPPRFRLHADRDALFRIEQAIEENP